MAYIKTPRGKLKYKKKFLYIGIKQIDRDVALENLKVVLDVLNKKGVTIVPACGTLLGIIREHNFIEWDEDIDTFVKSEDKDKLLDALWDLKEQGFEVARSYRYGHLYSIIRNNEYIDFYIVDKISPEVRTNYGTDFVFEKHLTELIDWEFRGVTIKVPKDYDECLEFLYGDWRTPVKWADFDINKWGIFKMRVGYFLKNAFPPRIGLKLNKMYHRKDLKKFLSRCEKRGVKLNYKLDF